MITETKIVYYWWLSRHNWNTAVAGLAGQLGIPKELVIAEIWTIAAEPGRIYTLEEYLNMKDAEEII